MIISLREPKLVLPTIVSGLTCYFDRSLGANLLYRFERPQYASVRKQYITGSHVIVGQEKEMSQVYGAEHFLRMLGRSHSLSTCDRTLTSISLPSSNDCLLDTGYGERVSHPRLCERTARVSFGDLSFVEKIANGWE